MYFSMMSITSHSTNEITKNKNTLPHGLSDQSNIRYRAKFILNWHEDYRPTVRHEFQTISIINFLYQTITLTLFAYILVNIHKNVKNQ